MDENLNVQQEQQPTLKLDDIVATLKEAGVEDIDGALKGIYEELKAHFETQEKTEEVEETEEEKYQRLFGNN